MSFLTDKNIPITRKLFYIFLALCGLMVAIALFFAMAEKVLLIIELMKNG